MPDAAHGCERSHKGTSCWDIYALSLPSISLTMAIRCKLRSIFHFAHCHLARQAEYLGDGGGGGSACQPCRIKYDGGFINTRCPHTDRLPANPAFLPESAVRHICPKRGSNAAHQLALTYRRLISSAVTQRRPPPPHHTTPLAGKKKQVGCTVSLLRRAR